MAAPSFFFFSKKSNFHQIKQKASFAIEGKGMSRNAGSTFRFPHLSQILLKYWFDKGYFLLENKWTYILLSLQIKSMGIMACYFNVNLDRQLIFLVITIIVAIMPLIYLWLVYLNTTSTIIAVIAPCIKPLHAFIYPCKLWMKARVFLLF